ncbi:MAG: MurR/RpiR family transcriptional regulator [Roseiarcus sp.]|jgi:DNA-binding MurR/RpiR family transcriptional regulator
MSIPGDFEALKDRLIRLKPDLPKRLQQVAAFALDNPQEMALGTASSIAARAHVQASTLVRFAQAVGFAGFSDLQALFRSHLRDRWPDYSERMKALHASAKDSGDPTHLLAGFADSATASLARLRQTVARADLERATALLSAADTIYLIGQRRAFSVSHYLAYAFAQLKVRAVLVDNVGSLGAEQMANMAQGDALVAISFAPYTPFTVDMTRLARVRATPIVVITDSPLSPLAGLADVRFEIAESDFGSFRSLAATFCLAITLAVALAENRASEA